MFLVAAISGMQLTVSGNGAGILSSREKQYLSQIQAAQQSPECHAVKLHPDKSIALDTRNQDLLGTDDGHADERERKQACQRR
jgi:hypothetical protein